VITLARLEAADSARVLHLQLGDGQQRFVHPIGDMVGERHAAVNLHVIARDDEVVGFFKIDHPVDRPAPYVRADEAVLRGFLIGAQFQGKGIARAAMVGFGAHMNAAYPGLKSVVLTVNTANPAAVRTYLGGGFHDAGELFHGGRSGPQHVLRLTLTP